MINMINDCVCTICPRYLYTSSSEWFCQKIDFVNVCLECGGLGGSIGNMNHRDKCKYNGCLHQGRPVYVRDPDTGINQYSDTISSYATWGLNQPNSITREYHLKCMQTRKDEIELARRKMARNVILKVFAIIQIKTGVLFNSTQQENWFFNSNSYIEKWINILSKKSNRKVFDNSFSGVKS